MSTEIERKFLIKLVNGWLPKELTEGPTSMITQGYLSLNKARQVRIRTSEWPGDLYHWPQKVGFITVKGKGNGISRPEFEYEIPFEDAVQMFSLCEGSLIAKTRTLVGRWEIDAFRGNNEGLYVAEIELESEDEQFDRPAWLGEEVTDDSRYSNMNLVTNPYEKWRT